MLSLLLSIFPPVLCLAIFKGRPGYYHRIMDIPSLCPHISFTQPWSPPQGLLTNTTVHQGERDKEVLILEVDNVSLSVSRFELPLPKEELTGLTGKKKTRAKTRCSQQYEASHCGPEAVLYNLVRLQWKSGLVELSKDTIEVTVENMSQVYSWTELRSIYLNRSKDIEVVINEVDLFENNINITVEDAFQFSVILTNETFTIWNKSESSYLTRPWLHLTSFPLISSPASLLSSSCFLGSLKTFFPGCNSLACVVEQCPDNAALPACCEWILGHSLLPLTGYPNETTSNYISFSRRKPCALSEPYSDPAGCGEGWTRFEYQCYKLITEHTGWHGIHRECKRLGGKLAVVVTRTEQEFMTMMSNTSTWVGHLASEGVLTEECPVLSPSGQLSKDSCNERKPGICRKLSCPYWKDSCCKMTRDEAWVWERRIMGRSVILRPGHTCQKKGQGSRQYFTCSSPYHCVVWAVFVCTVVGLICLRWFTRYRDERRYQAYNSSREKY